MLDMTVGELLQRLGSSDPAPGGGAAAALAGALGAALVQMTANLTIGRPRLADVEEQARAHRSARGRSAPAPGRPGRRRYRRFRQSQRRLQAAAR